MSKTPEDWVEFLLGAMCLGSLAITVSGFILALGWMTVLEMLQWK
jgi:hypothetical protein